MLTGALIFFVLLIAMLAIPVTVTFQVSWQQILQSKITLLWLFGLVRIKLPIPHSKTPSAPTEALAEAINRTERSSDKGPNLFSAMRHKSFRRRMIRFVRDVWHAIDLQKFRLHVRIGLGDPADTGQLWALMGPVAGMLATRRDTAIAIEPEFSETAFELESGGHIGLIPLQIIYLMAALLLSPAVWQGMQKARTGR